MSGALKRLKAKSETLRTEVVALYLSYKDSRTPLVAKLLVIITVAYAISPVDIIPDFIPILGYLDDLIILPLLITLSIKLLPGEVLEEYREKARENREITKKIGTWAAIFIIAIWIIIVIYILFSLLKKNHT